LQQKQRRECAQEEIPLSLQSLAKEPIIKEAQHSSYVVNGGKVPDNENERSNQVAKDITLPNFHETKEKNEAEELSQEAKAPIKVYQWWKALMLLFQLPLKSLND